ncbi:MFS transporter [Lacipirellula parvula]|uniref:Putative MFS-type transporter n=1 Tax=Lacipirellula parvula TaxID=2650471 RepID=A0A5K7XAQ0_9BACT|nr:MFS transporter [Lacipirellula parvula]BBO33047.1 putative MFS-type transporter [Lacipirellula parvula]
MISAALTRYRNAYAGLPREVWWLAFALFVNRCGTMVLPFLTLYLTQRLGMSESLAGRMVSVYGLGAVCGAYLGGRLAERFGAIRFQTVCMFAAAPGFTLIPLWQSWQAIAINLFLVSMVAEAVRPANAAAVTQLTPPDKRLRAFALQRLAANFGFSFGPALGGLLATIDFQWLFFVDALTTALAAGALLAAFRLRQIARVGHLAQAASDAPSPLTDRVFAGFLLLMLVNSMVFFQFGSTYPLYLKDHFGFDTKWIGAMFAVNTSVIVLFEMLLVDAIQAWPLLRTIGWGCLISCVGFGMLPFGQSAPYAVLAMLVLTMGEMLSLALSTGFVANRSRRGNEGAYMGWYMVMLATATVAGPAIGSAIYQVRPAAVWYVAVSVGVAVLAGFQWLARRETRPSEMHDAPPEWPEAMPQLHDA